MRGSWLFTHFVPMSYYTCLSICLRNTTFNILQLLSFFSRFNHFSVVQVCMYGNLLSSFISIVKGGLTRHLNYVKNCSRVVPKTTVFIRRRFYIYFYVSGILYILLRFFYFTFLNKLGYNSKWHININTLTPWLLL